MARCFHTASAERGLMRSQFADVALNGCNKCRILIRLLCWDYFELRSLPADFDGVTFGRCQPQ